MKREITDEEIDVIRQCSARGDCGLKRTLMTVREKRIATNLCRAGFLKKKMISYGDRTYVITLAGFDQVEMVCREVSTKPVVGRYEDALKIVTNAVGNVEWDHFEAADMTAAFDGLTTLREACRIADLTEHRHPNPHMQPGRVSDG